MICYKKSEEVYTQEVHFTRSRAIDSRTTLLARGLPSQTLVRVASQVMASQTCLKWLLGESDLRLPSQTRASNRAFSHSRILRI